MAKKNEIALISPELNKSLTLLSEIKSEVVKIREQCLQIKVADESTLSVAQQNLSKATQMVKFIEEKRIAIKEPFLQSGRKVDEVANDLKEAIETGIKHIKSEIKGYDTLKQELQLKAQKELEDRLKAEKEALNKEQERKDKITTYINNTIAPWLKSQYENCKSADDCDKILNYINTKYLPREKFAEFADMAYELKDNYVNLINVKKAQLISADTITDDQKELQKRELALAKMKEELAQANRELEAEKEKIRVEQERKDKEEEAEKERLKLIADNELNKTKGVKLLWKFEVVNIFDVDPEWLTINEAKVKEWLKDNKDKIVSGDVVEGIKYYQDKSISA